MQLLQQSFHEHILLCESSFVGFTKLWNCSLYTGVFSKEERNGKRGICWKERHLLVSQMRLQKLKKSRMMVPFHPWGKEATSKWILSLFFCIFITTIFMIILFTNLCIFLYFFTEFMAQSRAIGKGKRKGKNAPIGDAPPVPISLGSASVPSIGSGAATTTSNVEGRQQPQDNKYPLWKYVTREAGPGSKMKGGGNFAWKWSYCHNHFMSTYYCVKTHLLALPSCGISACTQVSLAKMKEFMA